MWINYTIPKEMFLDLQHYANMLHDIGIRLYYDAKQKEYNMWIFKEEN